jgi:hypothetical protein
MPLAIAMPRLRAGSFPHTDSARLPGLGGRRNQLPARDRRGRLGARGRRRDGAAYRRGDALQKRRELMELWASYLSGESSAKVVPITVGRDRP